MPKLKNLIDISGMNFSFSLEGLSGEICPKVLDQEVDQPFWLWLQNFYAPVPQFKAYGYPPSEGIAFAEKVAPDQAQSAAQRLWGRWCNRFPEREYILKKHAWTQGDEYWETVKGLVETGTIEVICSWEHICHFSRAFTNGLPTEANPLLVWMDNSGGFKVRGVWRNRFCFARISEEESQHGRYDEIVFDLEQLPSVEAIPHSFNGEWEGYM